MGQYRVVRAMRSNSKGAMLRMPSELEWRNCLLHLWTSLQRKWSRPTFSTMAAGCFLNRELRYQAGATSWCSARQNWSTERAFHSPQCSKEMSRKEIWRNSRSLPKTLVWTIWPTVCAHKCDENTYTFDRWSFARRSIANVPRTEWTSCHNKIVWLNLYWFRIPGNGWCRTVLHDEAHWKNLTIYKSQWHVVSTLRQEMKHQLTRKVGWKGTPKLDPYWKLQPVTCTVNMEWKSALNLWQKTFLTCGSEFLMA